MIRLPAFFIAVLIAIGTQVHAASFNCAKAHKGYEALICANQELSRADDALSDAYRRAHAALSLVGTEKEAKKSQNRLEKEQKEWLKTRIPKCPDVDCLQMEFQSRITTLRSYDPGYAARTQAPVVKAHSKAQTVTSPPSVLPLKPQLPERKLSANPQASASLKLPVRSKPAPDQPQTFSTTAVTTPPMAKTTDANTTHADSPSAMPSKSDFFALAFVLIVCIVSWKRSRA
jgi:uncharacterized protein